MINNRSMVSIWFDRRTSSGVSEILAILVGVALLSGLAQISLPLPFSPVPVTGQTFGVALLSLMWGKRAYRAVGAYLALGFVGLPIFANGLSGLTFGPTFGYLVGMLGASFLVGRLAERGAARSFWRALGAAYAGSMVIFACGLIGLMPFVGADHILVAGLLPFLPGDAIKNVLAAASASRANKEPLFNAS